MVKSPPHWFSRFHTFSWREWGLLVLVAIALSYSVWELGFMQPLAHQQQRLTNQLATHQATLTALQTSVVTAQSQADVADIETAVDLQALQAQYAQQNQQLVQLQQQLPTAVNMVTAVRDMLEQETALQLLTLQSTPTEIIFPEPAIIEEAIDEQIFKQSLKLSFQGNYLATLAYIQQLEALPWQLYWKELQIKVQDYPHIQVEMHVYTYHLAKVGSSE